MAASPPTSPRGTKKPAGGAAAPAVPSPAAASSDEAKVTINAPADKPAAAAATTGAAATATPAAASSSTGGASNPKANVPASQKTAAGRAPESGPESHGAFRRRFVTDFTSILTVVRRPCV